MFPQGDKKQRRMETSSGYAGRRRAFHGAHPRRVERIGYRRPLSQDTRQRRSINQSRPWQPILSKRQTSGGQVVRCHSKHR